jgi:hypothetical protein
MNTTTLTPEEQIVYALISNSKRITQAEIAKSAYWLGYHQKHEAHLNLPTKESTLRKIRQIIRDLRIKKGMLILSDKEGYWVVNNREEAVEYCQRIEKMAKAQARAWHETYSAMRKNFNIKSDYFDNQSIQLQLL